MKLKKKYTAKQIADASSWITDNLGALPQEAFNARLKQVLMARHPSPRDLFVSDLEGCNIFPTPQAVAGVDLGTRPDPTVLDDFIEEQLNIVLLSAARRGELYIETGDTPEENERNVGRVQEYLKQFNLDLLTLAITDIPKLKTGLED